MSKTCRICNQTKEESEFEKNRKVCKKCRNKLSYKTFKKDSIQVFRKLEKAKNKRLKNPEASRDYQRERLKIQKENDPEKVRQRQAKAMRNYRRKNKENYNSYERSLYQNNPNYKIAKLIRQRILSLIKGFKNSSSFELLGCSIDFLKEHLQQTAIQNGYLDFDIEHYSGKDYHIDHIIPCDAFNLQCSFHQRICFNWNNLQILEAKENLIKGESFLP